MTQQDSELPEGTDTVIPGAMDTDTNDVTGSRGGRGGGSRSGSRKSGSTGGTTGTALMEKVRSGGDRLSEQAAGKARDFVGQGIERSAEAIANVGKLVGDTASGLDERLGEEYGDYARKAAETLENTANKLAEKDPDELIDDTRNFIRKSPGIALAGAAIVGFALARLVKSGLSPADEDEDDDDRRPRSSRKRS
ncbi:MAG TPA: hypothetical protein VFU80_02290 [Sphingomicrobium sp.]|nr:hypothetical protein [Sphingomicrobium sp.]